MSASDDFSQRSDLARRRRRRRNSLLLLFVAGVLLFSAAAAGLYYSLRPEVLQIAVGPPGSDDEKLIQAMAKAFAEERRAVRLAPITTEGAVESLLLLGASKADLAVARADLEMPDNAESVALVRKNFVVLWTPSGRSAKGARKPPAAKIKEIADLAGRRVGVIGRTQANVTLLRLILTKSGVAPEKVAITQFATNQIEELAGDSTIDAVMAVGPLDSKITANAIAATARARGEPKFLAIDASEAIAFKHPLYEAEEIPPGVFNSSPQWPEDKVDTLSISHVIVARKALSDTMVAAFARQLFAIRHSLAKQVPGAAHIKKPDTDKDAALPVHRGAAAFIDGNERTFLERYSDYFWFSILLLSGLGSAGAWLRQFLKRDERDRTTVHRHKIMAMVTKIRAVESAAEIFAMQREVDAIIREALQCYDDGAIDEQELAAFGLVLELFHHVVAERREGFEAGAAEPARWRAREAASRPSAKAEGA